VCLNENESRFDYFKNKKEKEWKDRRIIEKNKTARRCSFLVVIAFSLLLNEKKVQTTLEMILTIV
jgi:hypothetical protein